MPSDRTAVGEDESKPCPVCKRPKPRDGYRYCARCVDEGRTLLTAVGGTPKDGAR